MTVRINRGVVRLQRIPFESGFVAQNVGLGLKLQAGWKLKVRYGLEATYGMNNLRFCQIFFCLFA